MHFKTRTTAALTLLGAVVCAPSPEARRTEVAIAHPVVQEIAVEAPLSLATLAPMRPQVETEQLERILQFVRDNAQRFDLDPVMLLAVIHVESRFDPGAVSSKGAMGLMQIRPTTAREVAGSLGIELSADEQLFDPELNILLGSCYLRYLVDRFDDHDIALSAYNAGPTRVAEQWRQTGDVPQAYPARVSKALERLTSL
jgi:soluble lytic murein transglycosylase-like protein